MAVAKGAAVTASTASLTNGILKWLAWAKLKTALVAGAGALLAAGAITVAVEQVPASGSSKQLPAEVMRQLEKQKASIQVLSLDTSVTYSRPAGIGYSETNNAYFDGNRYYYADRDRESTFDGKYAWFGEPDHIDGRSASVLTKFAPQDSGDPQLTWLYWKFPYLDAAAPMLPRIPPTSMGSKVSNPCFFII